MSKFILSAFGDEINPDLETQIRVMNENGIKYIEMRGIYKKNITEYSLDEVKLIKKQLDANGFKLSAIGSPIGKINITDEFAPHLELFKHTLEIAKVMETRYIRMFSFKIPKGDDPAIYRDEVMIRWEEFIRAAAGTGIILLHENEKGIYGDTAERCLDLFNTLDCSYLKAVFDPANFVQCDVRTYPQAFELLKRHIAYMHIKDALYSTRKVVPSGYGDGKVREILSELHKMGFEGFLSIEPHLGSFAGYSELELDSKVNEMPEGGPKQFAIAVEALRKVLNKVA